MPNEYMCSRNSTTPDTNNVIFPNSLAALCWHHATFGGNPGGMRTMICTGHDFGLSKPAEIATPLKKG